MSPQPRMEDEPPYRWNGGVFLNDWEVKGLIHALPQGSPLRSQQAANEAAAMAMRLNEVDRGAAV